MLLDPLDSVSRKRERGIGARCSSLDWLAMRYVLVDISVKQRGSDVHWFVESVTIIV
jgi:hypothetical protein